MRPGGDGGDDRRSLQSRIVLVGVVAVVVVLWVMSGIGAIEIPYLFSDTGATRLVVSDDTGDCREAGRDWGEGCDAAADITTITVWRAGHRILMAELELAEAPDLGPELEWTVDFYAETQNSFTDQGIICRLSNSVDGGEPRTEAVASAVEFRFSTEQLGRHACDGWLDGSTARFAVDVTGQPVDEEVRLVGSVKLEYPADPDRRGSEDDFVVRTTLADLPR